MSNHQRELRGAIRRVKWRWLAAELTMAVGRAALVMAALGLSVVALDRLLAPADGALLLASGLALAASVAAVVWSLWPYRRLPGDRQVARFVEERCAELEDRIATAVQVSAAGAGRGEFEALLGADAVARLRTLDPERLVSRSRLWRAGLVGAAGLALVTVGLIVGVDTARRAAHTAVLAVFPPEIEILVEPGDARLPAGQPLTIIVRLRGAPEGRMQPTLRITAGSEQHAGAMQPAGSAYRFEVPAVRVPFTYSVSAGRAVTREFQVTPLHAPRVSRIDVHYTYPSFTGLPPRTEEDGGDIYAPAGTDVRLRVHVDKPVETASLTMLDGTRLELEAGAPAGGQVLETAFRVAADNSYRIALADLEGLENPGDTEYFIRTIDDRPPTVRILRPAGDRSVTPLEEVVIEARADDDYGIDRFELVYAVRGSDERAVPFRGARGQPTVDGSHVLFLEDLDVEPGDFVTYYARARDVGRARRSSEARSDIFFLEVTPFEEEFVSAQSQSMGGAGSGEFADLVAAQKEIIIATWKLDRRAPAGTSGDDIKAVARAQAELRTRAQQAAAQVQRAGMRRRPRPGEPPPAPDQHPLHLAAEAMGQAQAALEATDAARALPHEMDALNHLMKAQADVRRRQVAMQSASAGGGAAGRPGQDLSALFDRELLRQQQQTNYETRQSAEPREERERSEALEKVRELARRQDELSRRQRELAEAGLTPEEIKRHLERLTREQTELRQQAEELARQLARQQQGQQSGQAGRQGQQTADAQADSGRQGGAGGQGGDDRLRAISEEMQRAASELRREDLGSASDRSGRAADQLRDLERELQAARPDERRRALGEMQLEARQIAEAQGRASAEAARLEGAAGSEDARRRLAGDKDRLADRVESLERAARQVAAGADGEQREALGEAARELERQQVGRRMRESAERWRRTAGEDSGAAGPTSPGRAGTSQSRDEGLAAAERELAQAMERVADRMAAAGGTGRDVETQKLSEQLAQARDLRDRLADVERRLEDLAERGDARQSEPGGEQASQSQATERGGAERSPAEADRGRSSPAGDDTQELGRLREEYDRQLRQAQEIIEQLRRDSPGLGGRLSTLEHQVGPPSASGFEAFKQDFASWDVLRRDINAALEQYEASLSQQLSDRQTQDRLSAGADDRMPEEYRALVAKYYEAIARKKKEERR